MPSGEHECSLKDMKDRFAINEHRKELFFDFERFIDDYLPEYLPTIMYIGGSYPSIKEQPNDIDVNLDFAVQKLDSRQQRAALRINEDRRTVIKPTYRVHVFVEKFTCWS